MAPKTQHSKPQNIKNQPIKKKSSPSKEVPKSQPKKTQLEPQLKKEQIKLQAKPIIEEVSPVLKGNQRILTAYGWERHLEQKRQKQ